MPEAGTLVATPTGLEAIESIEVGDLVLAYDETTGQVEAKAITDLIRPEPKPTYEVTLRSALGETETIRATADHIGNRTSSTSTFNPPVPSNGTTTNFVFL